MKNKKEDKTKLPVTLEFVDEINTIPKKYVECKRYNSEKMACYPFYKPISQIKFPTTNDEEY